MSSPIFQFEKVMFYIITQKIHEVKHLGAGHALSIDVPRHCGRDVDGNALCIFCNRALLQLC